MLRPTQFEIMRRNRRHAELVVASFAAMEAEAEWRQHAEEIKRWRGEDFKDTGEWLQQTARQAREKQPPQPARHRRRWFWPFRRAAA